MDILEKESLLTSTSIVQSVVFLGSQQKLYTAELTVLGSSGEGPQPAAQTPAQGSFDSEIFEVEVGSVKTTLADFSNEEISKMISFEASSGKEFLLVAAKTSGRIIRLDPALPGVTREVATGLDQPESMVIDPVTGDLLVAEQSQVTTVPQADLEAGSSALRLLPPGRRGPQRQELFAINRADGIAVDRCSGAIYFTDRTTGELFEYNRRSQEIRSVLSNPLQEPTRLLSVYRGRVSCPDSFHLLAIERGTDQILLVLAGRGTSRRWIPARQSTDISFIPRDNDFVGREAVLLTETVEEQQMEERRVAAVRIPDLYETRPDNPTPRDEIAEPEPDPEPEPQADVLVDLTILSDQEISVDCGPGGSAEYRYQSDFQIRGDVLRSGGASLLGVLTGSSFESIQGSGIFESEDRTCTYVGPIDVNINQSASATDVSGIWDFQTVILESCDDGEIDAGGGAGPINVTQSGDQLSGSFLDEEGSLEAVLPGECDVECAGDGTCTATCPNEGLSCALTCNKFNCGEDFQITGTVSPDPELLPSSEVEFTAVAEQELFISCSDSEGSTKRRDSTFDGQFSGTFRGGSTPVLSGSFSFVGGETCRDTGNFSPGEGSSDGCEGFEIDRGYFGVIFTEGVAQAPNNLSGLWSLATLSDDDDDEEADGIQFNVTQVGDAFSATALDDDDLPLNDSCNVTCSGPGQCTAVCPDFATCSITCDPATTGCGTEFLINGTVQ